MIRIALIGDIGSGKSHIAKQFGYPIFNADKEVNKLYKKSRKSFIKLKKILPKYINSFPVKKRQLSAAVISNQNNLKKIINIIHPEVRKKMKNFINKNKDKKIVVLDIPLIIENKINKKNDVIIFIDAKRQDIKKRLIKRKNYNPEILKKLRKFQLPLEIKKKKSNFILKNNFNNKYVKKNVNILKKKILLNVRNYT